MLKRLMEQVSRGEDAVQISRNQMREMGVRMDGRLAMQWQNAVDGAVGQTAEPSVRLQALADEVLKSLAPLGSLVPHLAVDVRQTAAWLELALKAGAAYRETRATALLHGAASLGALWFVDERLLPPEQILPPQPTVELMIGQLWASPQGDRFLRATRQARLLRPGLRLALRRALEQDFSAASLEDLMAAAFPASTPEIEGDGSEPAEEKDRSTAERFIAQERSLLAHSAEADRETLSLCLAGDLALGLGRCTRLLAGEGQKMGGQERRAWLRRAVHDLAGLAV